MNFETMTKDHLEDAQALTTSFNWPHTIEDWSFAFELGVGRVASNEGRLVGTCLTWNVSSDVSTLGLLTVAKEAQGQGLGRTLLRKAIEDQHGRTILLHATHQAIDLYSSEGFEAIGEVRQFQGTVLPGIQPVSPVVPAAGASITSARGDQLIALDFEANGMNRSKLLRALLPRAQIWVSGTLENPNGFAFCRPFGRGHVVGPVVAASETVAHSVINDVLNAYVGSFVRIDLTEEFTQARALTERGMNEVDRVLAMSNGPLPEGLRRQKRFALIGHAFG